MAHKFNEDEKEVREFAPSMPFGVSEVQFTGAIADVTEAGKEFIEVGVVNVDGVEDFARLWFVGGASNISFNTLRQIAVHCGKDDAQKEEIRQAVDKVADSAELVQVLNHYCKGGHFWFTKYYDAKGRTFTNDFGTFKSINKSVMGYQPKERPELMPKPADNSGNPLGGQDITDDGSEAANNIPNDWSKK